MLWNMENLEIESVIRAPSSLHRRYEDRASHALVLKLGGPTRYFFEDRTLVLGVGQLLFLPKGCCYTVQRADPWESEYCLINFRGDIPSPQPWLVNLPAWADAAQLCRELTELRICQTPTDRYRRLALFYTLAACICREETSRDSIADPGGRIAPAVEYLKKHMFDPELRMQTLYRLCGISDTSFRKLFAGSFGVTPKKYILEQRLRHAKTLLDHGEYDSICQAALLSGFSDPLYFSKAFKKQYGYPPSHRP